MDKWVERYIPEAKHLLELGCVREIDFAGSTYQVEIFDPVTEEYRWPLLQFDEHDRLRDAFCSCPSENGKCIHLAAAYIAILGTEHLPLHKRFERSFWNHLCQLFGDHAGYEESYLVKQDNGHYVYRNLIFFDIQAKNRLGLEKLEKLIEKRTKVTPENSIKFSNLPQDEITHWREGRPSPFLRYLLSFWADLAKWLTQESPDCVLSIYEDDSGYPTRFKVDGPTCTAHFFIQKKDLPKLIPSLDTVKSSLKVFQTDEEKIKKISFDPRSETIFIEHLTETPSHLQEGILSLEGWDYIKGKGFYPKDGESLLGRARITKEQIPDFLTKYWPQVAKFIPVSLKKMQIHYTMYFDKNWNWHFSAYLFQEGDLAAQGSWLSKSWAYLDKKGFISIENPVLDTLEETIPASQVSNFVNHHRIWLNGQEGFQTHLASVESRITYNLIAGHTLIFQAKSPVESMDTKDFGEWIYYSGQGFFSKKHARLGVVAVPGLEVKAAEIPSFIKLNRDELETIPLFFTTVNPLASRRLEIKVRSPTSLEVKPVYTVNPLYENSKVYFFGDFLYLEGQGFCELPLEMRLPEPYSKPVIISQAKLHDFLQQDLPILKKYCQTFEQGLTAPHKLDLAVNYLARTASGGLKAQLFYQTEMGQIPLTDLLEALDHKRRYCFTQAGLIDLQADSFLWLRFFKNPRFSDSFTVELSPLDLIRLDAQIGLLGPIDDNPTSQITRQVLKELREFSSHETPNLKGLTSSLRLYQQTGLHWLWFLYKNGLSGLLCDDMGLGKTHQAMALLAATFNLKMEKPKKYLVVCPTSVIYHWQDKLAKFLPGMPVHTFYGLKRTLKDMPEEGVLLTSYGILRMEKIAISEIPFEVAVFDEVQVAKNPSSRVHEAIKNVRARMRVGLTGTPIENNLRELKALFDIVLPGYMPGEARFREVFIQPIERSGDEEKKALLSQMIRPFVLRRRKTEVLQELPEKSEDKSFCDLSADQTALYMHVLAQMQGTLIAELRDPSASVNYLHVFSLLSQLKQICDHPALFHKNPKNYKSYASGKWDLFVELLEEARESEQKVVIFSQYLYMLDIIELHLKEKGWGYAQIRGDTQNRREELKRFQEDPSCVVFIGSLQAAGLGIDLTAASVVIMYDRWWNAARENQAIDRVHRIGQKWGVQVYKLITKNTIEEKIDRMITRKGRLLEDVVAADDQDVLKKFTRSELMDLLTFSEAL
jgi:superfamily II DNA or RNA helicase